MNPDPNAYRPSSLDLEDAARMKSESELESTQAHTMRNNRDLEAVMAIACLVITLSMVESTPFLAIIPVRDRNRAPMRRRTRAGTRGEDDARIPRDRLHPRKRTRCQRLPEHHGTPAPMEDSLTNLTPDIAMGTCGINEGNRRGKQ